MKTMSTLYNISPISTLLSQFLKALKSLQTGKNKERRARKESGEKKKKDWHFYIVVYFGKKRGLSKAQFLSHNFHKSRPMLKSIYESITLWY